MRARIGLAATLVLLVLMARPASALDGPRAVVESLNAALLDAMKQAESLGFEGRYDRLAPTLEQTFNFAVMCRVAAGSFWSKMSEAERTRLTDAFARMSIATFAARFDGYSGESFETLESEPARREAVLVKSRLLRGDNEPVALNYLLREYDGGWRVVDVFLDAKFSELARQRAEFTSILQKDGLEGLIQAIERKIETLSRQ